MRTTMIAALACATLSLSAGSIALAGEPPGGAPPQSATFAPQAQSVNPKDEVICKNIRELGSRIKVNRVCMTRADWEMHQKDAQETADKWQHSGAPQNAR
jgi:hypothetical protein